ncbi:MAG: class I SAM-dependent methyltransferase [Maioricimonas sp. JB045]
MDTAKHNRTIIDQFSLQAVPFAELPAHSQEESTERVLRMAGVAGAARVLDVACGPGLVACEAARYADEVVGIDITPAMIEQARKRQQDRGLANVVWKEGDVLPLPFGTGGFDCVLTRYSFHHFPDPAAVFGEMLRVCRPGGTVCVVDVFTRSPDQSERFNAMEKLRDPSHVRALSLPELTGMFETAGMCDVATDFYKVTVELEAQLASSFPNPGDADRIRDVFREDVTTGRLGVESTEQDGQIHYSYPIAVIAGRKPSAPK